MPCVTLQRVALCNVLENSFWKVEQPKDGWTSLISGSSIYRLKIRFGMIWCNYLMGPLILQSVLLEHSASNWLLRCVPPSAGPTRRSKPTPSPSSTPSSWKHQRTDGRSEFSCEALNTLRLRHKATSLTSRPLHHRIELSTKQLENNRHNSHNNI